MELLRGKKKDFVNKIFVVMGNTRPKFLVLMKTKVPIQREIPIFQALGYDCWWFVKGSGFSKGI